VDNVFKALADPSRRALLDQLHHNNGQTLNELCQHLEMSRQAVTKHLRLLEAANLVVPLWHGRKKLHYLNPVPLHQITERWIDKYQHRIPLALNELERGLESIQTAKK
jgi:DNA-binding transcriptional ArsR family regulator